MQAKITSIWYKQSFSLLSWLLLPFSIIFSMLVRLRRFLYQKKWLKSYKLNVPIIIVGNITVGGTGKTPFIIWLAQFLKDQGFHPGIISRGVGGYNKKPHLVNLTDKPERVGDEALLLARHAECPVVIGHDRVKAAHEVLKNPQCNIILSDDGLQHYRLQREIEIAIVDSERGVGNGRLLPAGPLREPIKRLDEVDYVIYNGNESHQYSMRLKPIEFVSVPDQSVKELAYFKGIKVHAVAGIGNPERFFNQLKVLGLDIIPHVFPDHYAYRREDLIFSDDLPVIMTEKDAVKCEAWASSQYWYLRIKTEVSEAFENDLFKQLQLLGVNNDVEEDFYSKQFCGINRPVRPNKPRK